MCLFLSFSLPSQFINSVVYISLFSPISADSVSLPVIENTKLWGHSYLFLICKGAFVAFFSNVT